MNRLINLTFALLSLAFMLDSCAPRTQSTNAPAAPAPSKCDSIRTSVTLEPRTGLWLAFSAMQQNNADIFSFEAKNASAIWHLTNDAAADLDPTWSPDGNRIAFRSQRDGNDEIYVMNADGSCQTNLTDDPENELSPAWSPDGKRIAFARFFDGNPRADIAVINLDGSGFQRLTHAGGEYPAWSPNGTQIAFASARDGNYEIYVMNADGTNQTRLTNNPAYDMSPAWSPDGKRIAFDTQRDFYPPKETGIGPEFEIHVMNADGSGDVRLTNNQAEDRFPAWGPTGLAFTHDGRLFVMNPDGNDQHQILPAELEQGLHLEGYMYSDWWPRP